MDFDTTDMSFGVFALDDTTMYEVSVSHWAKRCSSLLFILQAYF